MREAGASEIHMRIGCPPIKFPDFYGIDTPETEQLLAANKNLEEMYMISGMRKSVYFPCRLLHF